MEIGKKLRTARLKAKLTQEKVAENIHVSRQTISNWENEKSYPDILSVIMLSDLYDISLDELLKGDEAMLKHLDESTNLVSSNKKLIVALSMNVLLMVCLFVFIRPISGNPLMLFSALSILLLSTAILFYQIIKKF